MKRKEDARLGRVVFGLQNPLNRSIHPAPNPPPGIDVLDDPLSADDSPEVAQRKLRKIHSATADLIKFKDASADEIKRIGNDLARFTAIADKSEETRMMAQQALDLARANSGTVPDSISKDAQSFIRALAVGAEPDDEFCKLARVQSIGRAYFNLISHTGKDVEKFGAPEEVQHLLARMRIVNDSIFMLNKYFSVRDTGTYAQLGGMKGLRLWKEWESLCKRVQFSASGELEEAVGGNGVSISAWVPTIWSGNLINLVQILARCANYIPSFQMQSLTQKALVEGADVQAYYISEGSSITLGNFTAFDATWTAKKMAARVIASREINQDSAVPFTQEVERKIAKAIARGTEDMLINGQATGTTPGGAGSLDSGQTIAAGDVRLMTNGLRYWHAQTGLGVKDAGAGITIESCAKLRGPMGAYGVDPSQMIWLCSAWGAAHLLTLRTETGLPVFLSPMGNAQSPPGTVGTLLDSPIVLSSFVNDDYNSTGVRDGAGSTTCIYYPNVQQFMIGERLGIVVEASTHIKFDTDQIMFRAVRRLDFQPVRTPSATDPMINAIGNLSLA